MTGLPHAEAHLSDTALPAGRRDVRRMRERAMLIGAAIAITRLVDRSIEVKLSVPAQNGGAS